MVPEDTDGLRALLGGDQAELHGDGFVQRVLQQLVVVVDSDTDHWRVDDRTLWHPEDNVKEIHDQRHELFPTESIEKWSKV